MGGDSKSKMRRRYKESAKELSDHSLTMVEIVNSRQLSLSGSLFEGFEETYLVYFGFRPILLAKPSEDMGLSSGETCRRVLTPYDFSEGRLNSTGAVSNYN